jgi:hypothetical protein
MFICLTCKADEACINYTALEALGEYDFGLKCPTKDCGGVLLQIDDGIAEAVTRLNDLGYTTNDSCSGHFNNATDQLSFYVGFDEGSLPPTETLPEGFWVMQGNENCRGDSIWYLSNREKAAEFAEMLEFQEGNRTLQVLEVNRKFLEWVLTLPVKA